MTITNLKDIIERNISEDELHLLYSLLIETFEKYDISTKLRQCHFIGQSIHESREFSAKRESLNYSVKALIIYFKKYFYSKTPIEGKYNANEYGYIKENGVYVQKARQQDIANIVYGGRMGNVFENDGWLYRGGGDLQATGRKMYTRLSKSLQQDFISNPDFIGEYPYYILSGGFIWDFKGLNKYADKNDIVNETRRLNGGLNGLNDRIKWVEKAKRILN